MSGIKKFVEKVLESKSNKLEKFKLGKISQIELDMLKEKTNFDLSEYERVIDSYGIKHAFKKHGDDKLEKMQGQLAIKPDDFEKIPEICLNPDKVKSGIKNKFGNELIQYTKKFDDEITYIEEKRDGKKELGTKTMYIRKACK
ncbi:MAG: hypothetical protein B6I20_05090 [Bacteroidetes bacterium 4572_117]|nr:MAG: hypothetical protein B6I20_05090 [Bacteroidetes bacterium 4572_117]